MADIIVKWKNKERHIDDISELDIFSFLLSPETLDIPVSRYEFEEMRTVMLGIFVRLENQSVRVKLQNYKHDDVFTSYHEECQRRFDD